MAHTEAHYLDAAAVTAVLAAAEGLRYKPVLTLIAATGLRRGEALALRWEHVNFTDGLIKVACTVSRVGAKPGVHRGEDGAQPADSADLAGDSGHAAGAQGRPGRGEATSRRPMERRSGLGVHHRGGAGPSSRATSCGPSRPRRPRLGVEDVGVHTLRHSAAAAWLDAGVHIKAVADLLGHSSIAVTGDISWACVGRHNEGCDRRSVGDTRAVNLQLLDAAVRRAVAGETDWQVICHGMGRNDLPALLSLVWQRNASQLVIAVGDAWTMAEFPQRMLHRREWLPMFRAAGYHVDDDSSTTTYARHAVAGRGSEKREWRGLPTVSEPSGSSTASTTSSPASCGLSLSARTGDRPTTTRNTATEDEQRHRSDWAAAKGRGLTTRPSVARSVVCWFDPNAYRNQPRFRGYSHTLAES